MNTNEINRMTAEVCGIERDSHENNGWWFEAVGKPTHYYPWDYKHPCCMVLILDALLNVAKNCKPDTFESLIKEYDQFLEDNKLPELSADELAFEIVDKAPKWQMAYLFCFIERWNKANE